MLRQSGNSSSMSACIARPRARRSSTVASKSGYVRSRSLIDDDLAGPVDRRTRDRPSARHVRRRAPSTPRSDRHLGIVGEREESVRAPLRDVQREPILCRELDPEPLAEASASPAGGRRRRRRSRPQCSERASPPRAERPGSACPRSVPRSAVVRDAALDEAAVQARAPRTRPASHVRAKNPRSSSRRSGSTTQTPSIVRRVNLIRPRARACGTRTPRRIRSAKRPPCRERA